MTFLGHRLTESKTGLTTLSRDLSADDDTSSVSTAVVEGNSGAWVRLILFAARSSPHCGLALTCRMTPVSSTKVNGEWHHQTATMRWCKSCCAVCIEPKVCLLSPMCLPLDFWTLASIPQTHPRESTSARCREIRFSVVDMPRNEASSQKGAATRFCRLERRADHFRLLAPSQRP